MTSFQELIAVPVPLDVDGNPCTDVTRQDVGCPDSETLSPSTAIGGNAYSAPRLSLVVVAAAAAILSIF